MVDDVRRRRIEQAMLRRWGCKGDPLYSIRRTLQVGSEHLTEKQAARLNANFTAGYHGYEVTLTWQRDQKLRNIYHAGPERGRELGA